MKRTLTVLTAAIFAGAMAVPAFAQNTGAGVGVNVGGTGMHAGVNGDLNNSDAEHAQPNPGSSSSETSVRASNESATNTTADQGADAIKPRFRRHAKKSSSDSSIVEPSNAGISAGADANSGMNVGNK